MQNSKIEWTDNTWNPIRIEGSRSFYCVKVSPGCENCYAERMAKRLAAMGGDASFTPYKATKWMPPLELNEKILDKWKKLQKPQRHFVSSMTDVFGEFVPIDWIYKILDAMVVAHKQHFQVLTKRAQRMRTVVDSYCTARGYDELPGNIMMMVSVEDQRRAEERIVYLVGTKCKLRGLSCEPLLGPVHLGEHLKSIDWVIVGGESGPGARPMHPDWVRAIQQRCSEVGVPFFFKQWGEWLPWEDAEGDYLSQNGQLLCLFEAMGINGWDKDWADGCHYQKVGKHAAGRKLDGIEYSEFCLNH